MLNVIALVGLENDTDRLEPGDIISLGEAQEIFGEDVVVHWLNTGRLALEIDYEMEEEE